MAGKVVVEKSGFGLVRGESLAVMHESRNRWLVVVLENMVDLRPPVPRRVGSVTDLFTHAVMVGLLGCCDGSGPVGQVALVLQQVSIRARVLPSAVLV